MTEEERLKKLKALGYLYCLATRHERMAYECENINR